MTNFIVLKRPEMSHFGKNAFAHCWSTDCLNRDATQVVRCAELEVWCHQVGSLNLMKTSESWIWKGTMRTCGVTVTPWQKGGGIALCKYGWSHLICCMQILHLLVEGFHYNLAMVLDHWDFNLEILHSHFGIWESWLMPHPDCWLCFHWLLLEMYERALTQFRCWLVHSGHIAVNNCLL